MKLFPTLLCLTAAPLLFAADGAIQSIQLEPASVKAGQEVKITITADGESPSYCGMRVALGDGETRDVKIDAQKKSTLPYSLTKTYAQPGKYEIKADGKKVTAHLPCKGSAHAQITVAAQESAAAASSSAAPNCPSGYQLKGKVMKSGAFTCVAGKGATAPKEPLPCPNGLHYFQKKSSLGCSP